MNSSSKVNIHRFHLPYCIDMTIIHLEANCRDHPALPLIVKFLAEQRESALERALKEFDRAYPKK